MTDLTQFLPEQSKTVSAIFAHHKKVGDAELARGYLGASIIGHHCERYLWYCFRQCCKPDFDGRMYRLFETGDLEESRFIKELRAIGCTVHDVTELGEQFEVSALGGHFSGHMDGCALGIPEAPKTWHVLEFKTHNAKSFKELKKKGVKESKPQHYAQMQVYMHLTGMKRALYLARNKDTDDLFSERVHYETIYALQLMDRAKTIIESTAPPERIASRPDHYQCSWCDAKQICWSVTGTESTAFPISSLSCRQCCHATPCLGLDTDHAQWTCEKHKRGLSPECQARPCDHHLILPGLLAFAEPSEYSEDELGYGYIEFTNHDGHPWRHGYAYGGYRSKELMKLPASLLKNEMINTAKDLFGAKVTDCQFDILDRYPKGDSRTIWEGSSDELAAAWQSNYGEDLLLLTPITGCVLPFHSAAEFEGDRVAIIWSEREQIGINRAEIREGVE